MNYQSTRNSQVRASSAQAIADGISPDGGLYVPEQIPKLTESDFAELSAGSYVDAAARILGLFLTDFSAQELRECAEGAYLSTFDKDCPAPLHEISDGVHLLELWHGPTCAFKDLALQILPYLLTKAAHKTSDGEEKVILVATSGDTGKAALEGFCDVPGTRILVFYPEDGVSPMQKLQMITQKGQNVGVCAIKGNFDDAQTGVKKIFTDPAISMQLKKRNMAFSSANSINWGRLAPQIVYYIWSYCQLLRSGRLKQGDSFNIVVPTGNFGNILAAYYAREMGLPVAKLICASNRNNVLTDFLRTGVYDRNRDFFTTLSPSMDILISSNLERLLFHLTGGDSSRVSNWMAELSETGRYQVDSQVLSALSELFYADCCDDYDTKITIAETFENFDYLCDTHTAVALNVYNNYVTETLDESVSVVASTASPFKFAKSVLSALTGHPQEGDELSMLDELSRVSGAPVPAPLASLKGREPRFTDCCTKETMNSVVLKMLGIE